MSFWEIKAAAKKGEPAELLVYGDIGEWLDVDSRKFTSELKAIDSDQITVRINSGGGSVFTAQAILSSLRRHKAKVTVYVDGLAASAASVIAMAGDKVIMPANAMMMIHNPLTWAGGEAADFRKMADTLDQVRMSIVAAYREKTGLEDEAIIELMDAETWMTADDAVEWGFADEVESAVRIAASANHGNIIVNGQQVDVKRYKNASAIVQLITGAGDQDHPAPQLSNNTGVSAGEITEEQEKKPMNLEQLKAEHPDLYSAVLADGEKAGVEKERARIQAIEDMAMKGHETMIAAAKFDTGITAEALAVQIIKAEKAKAGQFLADRAADADEIGDAANPGANEGNDPDAAENEKKEKFVNLVANAFRGQKSEI